MDHPSDDPPSPFLGSSRAAGDVRAAILRSARADACVLITGESGTGKELVAREIHERSRRSRAPFVPLNCAAIPETLIESELFGHEAGAYTDARTVRRGLFELADRGTLFLDEIGDLAMPVQPKLLRALEDGEVARVGGETRCRLDLRVIAATNHDLKGMVREGRFRADLYYRVRVLDVRIPPLRERLEDLEELATKFARAIAQRSGREFRSITPAAIADLRSRAWRGNVRELRAVVERAMALTSGPILDVDSFVTDPESSAGVPLQRILDADWKTARCSFEKTYATTLLSRHGGDVRAAARAAGLAVRSLYKILHRLGLRPER